MDKFTSLSTSETCKTSQLTFKESVVLVTGNGKVLKRRRLSYNQFITDDDLEAVANDPEEGKGSQAVMSLFSIVKQMGTIVYGANKTWNQSDKRATRR